MLRIRPGLIGGSSFLNVFFPVPVGDQAEEEGVKNENRNVAAEIEGEDETASIENQSSWIIASQILSRQQGHPEAHQYGGCQRT